MRYLRTVSTRRLLAVLLGIVVVAIGGTAIAVASSGSGPVPSPKPLAQAIHDALAAKPVTAITANIAWTNNLIDSSELQGSDPLLQGGSGWLYITPNGRHLRLELASDNGPDPQLVINGNKFWVYEPSAHTVYRGTLPAQQPSAKRNDKPEQIPSVAEIQKRLNQLAAHLNISGAQPTDVGGQPTYTVSVSPKHDGGLLGSVALAWDALRGAPLRFAVYASGNPTPVLELKATDVSYKQIPASTFTVQPPTDVKSTPVSMPADKHGTAHRSRTHKKEVHGAAAVAKQLPFPLVAPTKLVGLPRQSVSLLDWGGHPAALVTYGQNLGGMAVIEQRSAPPSAKSGNGHTALTPQTVSLHGVTGQELDTAIGTVVHWSTGGVSYTVIGSVPPAAADAAARAL